MKVYAAEKNDELPPSIMLNSPPSSVTSSSLHKKTNKINQFLNKYLTNKSSSSDYSELWRQNFSQHPSWCDADMCLQQIHLGNATGNIVALYSRAFFQRILFKLGDFIQCWPKAVICYAIFFLTISCIGLKHVKIETDLVKLWVEQGGILDEELAFFGQARAKYYFNKLNQSNLNKRSADSVPQLNKANMIKKISKIEILSDTGLNGGFQVVIQTPEKEGENVLTRDSLLRHVQILEEIARYEVEMFGETWSLSDICFKPPAPKIPKNNILANYQYVFDKLIPCIWITPADCFWEASKVLGPYPSINLDIGLPHLPKGNLSWKTLDPELLLQDLSTFKDYLGNVNEVLDSLFKRAGVGHAYQDRNCIDPLDYECPSTAPNYFDRCKAYKKFLQWNNKQPKAVILTAEEIKKENSETDVGDIGLFLSGRRKKREQKNNQSSTFLTNSTNSSVFQEKSLDSAKEKKPKKNVTTSDDYYDEFDAENVKLTTTESIYKKKEKEFNAKCERYARSFLLWMNAVGPNNWQFLNETVLDNEKKEIFVNPPQYPAYGEILTNGCKGFGKNIMKWPEDLIIGGIKRENGLIAHAEAFQSVFLVAAPNDVYQRFKDPDYKLKPNLDTSTFTINHAGAIIQNWQRKFTDRLYVHPLNSNKQRETLQTAVKNRNAAIASGGINVLSKFAVSELITENIQTEKKQIRVIHPLASTSIQDMLKEFSEFQFGVIFVGYLLMLLYAGFTQLEWDGWWFSVRSNCFLAVIGVFIITFASVAGLGVSALIGIHFNAATTQIVPFLTLGLGIDDLFLFLHNYNNVLESVKKKEVAILVKETGMSILITSSNNILAFLAGIILPVPALRSFCAQTAILLSFNLMCIVIVFPAFVTLDLRRRKAGIRDMLFGFFWADSNGSFNKLSQKNKKETKMIMMMMGYPNNTVANNFPLSVTTEKKKETNYNLSENNYLQEIISEKTKWFTLEGFLRLYYIPFLTMPWAKVLICMISLFMFTFGCIGLKDSVLGLELSDVLPENTPPAAFLKAREKYFSFYPMFIVLKEKVDYPNQQDTIEQLRLDIGKSNFLVKGDTILRHVQEPSEHHWIWFMRQWLISLQNEVELAIQKNYINPKTGKILHPIKEEAAIGRRLLCSSGIVFNCTEKLKMKLVDKNGIIKRDSFYNCLTAWYNVDNMMYYVSQGQIFPPPPSWFFNSTEDVLIPPAEPIVYSQLPFYMTGLTDTPVIVKMIEEIRAICNLYTYKKNLPVFPSGIPFTFWEQYINLTNYLFAAIVIIGVTVLCIISILVFNPWAAAMVAIVVISMTVELGGFMGLFGVKMNPISAVTLITAVGIGVEFTAHVVLAFLTSLGTRNERMISCLKHMFVPVVHGVFSTLLGIIMLAFSEFDFVVKYFFVVMTVLILIGMFNGLAMLPVMLSLIGPPCEVNPIDGGKILKCPPPLKRSKKNEKLNQEHQSINDNISTNNFDVVDNSNNTNNFNTSLDQKKKLSLSSYGVNQIHSPSISELFVNENNNLHVYHDSLSTLHEINENERASVAYLNNQHLKTPRSSTAPLNIA